MTDNNENVEIKEEKQHLPLLDDIDMLRKREDVSELEDILKANILGGYSRKKVLDYIGSIREQQFKAEEKFRKNLKELIEQKEELRRRLDQSEVYITELEDRNYDLSDDIKKFSEGDVGKYQNKIAEMQNKLSDLEKEIISAEDEKHNLIAQLQLKSKNIIELEDKNQSITSKLLEMENLELQKEREFHLELEKQIEKLKEELQNAQAKVEKHKEAEKVQKNEILELKESLGKLNEAYEASKASVISIQENLIKKEDAIAQNCNRYEVQLKEIEDKYQTQLSDLTSNMEISQKIILDRKSVV